MYYYIQLIHEWARGYPAPPHERRRFVAQLELALNHLDAHLRADIEELREWVRIPSISPSRGESRAGGEGG